MDVLPDPRPGPDLPGDQHHGQHWSVKLSAEARGEECVQEAHRGKARGLLGCGRSMLQVTAEFICVQCLYLIS